MHRVADQSKGQTTGATTNPCRCGCGKAVRRTFAQGHDQVFLASLRHRVSVGEMTADQAMAEAATISRAFVTKVTKSLAIVVAEKAREGRKEANTGNSRAA